LTTVLRPLGNVNPVIVDITAMLGAIEKQNECEESSIRHHSWARAAATSRSAGAPVGLPRRSASPDQAGVSTSWPFAPTCCEHSTSPHEPVMVYVTLFLTPRREHENKPVLNAVPFTLNATTYNAATTNGDSTKRGHGALEKCFTGTNLPVINRIPSCLWFY